MINADIKSFVDFDKSSSHVDQFRLARQEFRGGGKRKPKNGPEKQNKGENWNSRQNEASPKGLPLLEKKEKKLGILRFHIHARLSSVMLSEAMPIKHFIHFTEQWTSILAHRETSETVAHNHSTSAPISRLRWIYKLRNAAKFKCAFFVASVSFA